MSEVKFCADCQNYLVQESKPPHACTRKATQKTDIVTGKTYLEGMLYCYPERDHPYGEQCGPDAIHFIPKKDTP